MFFISFSITKLFGEAGSGPGFDGGMGLGLYF